MSEPLFFQVTYARNPPFVRNFRDIESKFVRNFRDIESKFETNQDNVATSFKYRRVEPKLEITEGSQWFDVIGVGIGKPWFILSERVIEIFQKNGVTGYEPAPVTIEKIKGKKLQKLPPPWYFYIKVTGLLDIDFAASGIPESERTNEILDGTKRPQVVRFVPNPDTWDGADFVTFRNYPTGHLICTRRIIELAHEHKLTNFNFQPIDLLNHQAVAWGKGVNYLGKKWPPEWYPSHARTIKSLDQWLKELCQLENLEGFKLHNQHLKPILDFGLEALPGLIRIMQNESLQARKNAARVIYFMRSESHFRLPKDVAALAAEYLPDHLLD